MGPLLDDMNTAVNMNSDVPMIREAFPAMLVQLDGLIQSDPENDDLLLKAAEAYCGYGFAFVEDQNPARAGAFYLKAREYGLRVLKRRNSFFAENYARLDINPNELLKGFTRSDARALYWTANAWIGWIALNIDKPEPLMDLHKVESLLLKVLDLDESFHYGAAHILIAMYYSVPKAVGGNPEKALDHFNRAFALSQNKILIYRYFFAKAYAIQALDRNLFTKTLKEIIDAPTDLFPEMNFANALAKEKAKALLDQADTVF
jgi:hypothetical protein